jgi:hypothetical protein
MIQPDAASERLWLDCPKLRSLLLEAEPEFGTAGRDVIRADIRHGHDPA